MYIEIKTQLIVDDEEILSGSCIKIIAKSGEIVTGNLDYISGDNIDVDSKVLGTVTIEIDKIESIWYYKETD